MGGGGGVYIGCLNCPSSDFIHCSQKVFRIYHLAYALEFSVQWGSEGGVVEVESPYKQL